METTAAMISYGIIYIILFGLILEEIGWVEPLYAHNDIKVQVPVATHEVTLDGNRSEEEWRDASKFNFSSPTHEGKVSNYLQYDLTEKSLLGAFFIPDRTPVDNYDQIAFLFDVNHSALNTTDSGTQYVVFIRNGTSEYYTGLDKQDDLSQENGIDEYTLVERATANSNGSSGINLPQSFDSPFSGTEFVGRSDDKSWQGEFKIIFKENPKLMGFSISQVDNQTNKSDDHFFFVNYPKETTNQANIPSSWGDISFPLIDNFVENSTFFCPNTAPTYSPNKVFVLCSSLNMPSISEDEEENLVIVSGALANVISGTGISDKLEISIKDSRGIKAAVTKEHPIKDDDDGQFEYLLETKGLRSGRYEVSVRPESIQHNGLVSTAELMVNPRALTIQEFSVFIGIAATAIGLVAYLPQIRSSIKRNKQTQNMVKELGVINVIYDKQDLAADRLRQERDNALTMLQNSQINQEQFSLLDNKISEYLNKLQKNEAP